MRDSSEQELFFNKLLNLPKKVKMRFWGNKRLHRGRRIEYIIFAGKEREANELINHINVIEKRYKLALHCLEETRKECENITDSESKFNELKSRAKSNIVNLEFVIKAEYFIYSINSCLDVMSYFIKNIYNLEIKEPSIGKVYDRIKSKRDKFSRYFLKEWRTWIKAFRDIRNRMTHHQIISFSSQLNHQPQTKQVIYTKHCISVIDRSGDEVLKPLPKYFEEVIKNYAEFKNEFYKNLNSIM